MKNQSGMSDKTDIKIFILFLLDEIHYPLDDTTLSRIIQENGYVGMFDFAECFSELLQLGHISQLDQDGVRYYHISDSGHMVASELQDNIMQSIREKSSRSAAKLLSLYKRGATPTASVEAMPGGRYRFTAAITAKGEELMRASLSVATREEGERMRALFLQKPEELLRGMLSLYSGEIDYLLNS